MQVLGHVRNTCGAALGPMFEDFHASLLQSLPPEQRVLVHSCASFVDFNKVMMLLRDSSNLHQIMQRACQGFCKEYKLQPDFWVQARALEEITMGRNQEVHCSIAESASTLSTACDNSDDYPEFERAWTMIEALANYGMKHALALDQEAAAQRVVELRATAKFKERRQQEHRQQNGAK
ncbi:hypothetical protein TSOC_004928 [Tetrabaena socialis]|uniref:Uncharacterized protein n=1 Tax=Tetrabaena socialis TaxID=47790 RepID=A0A2J8A7K8_9CHLO|nr:hypothetical protein TSOC_013248 [Tetrabaena socialis]PNH08519.1 hypothetical protein TSOC_004928 [Tetrabaena socialis]|eukprot:PNH00900.1 hypothetical protein TSOC_013248 [Tetrabaena socialis]